MSVKTVKFGGTSLCNAENFTKVKNIILADKARKYVVPSAPGKRFPGDEKITDLLYLCYAKNSNGLSFDDTFEQIAERYVGIEQELGLKTNIAAELSAIKKNILSGASEDYIASRGEYLSGLLLADYLGFDFYDAAELISFHADGTYDDETTQKWTQKLADTQNVVVPGFYGRKRDGSIKTFSRGGSDISGAIVARAVQADVYENWTDVSGFLMADPRIVDNPKVISVVTYSELRELSYMGATVLHEDSIFPVRRAQIPINVRNTNRPEDEGTMVIPDAFLKYYKREGVLTGVAGRKGFTVITVYKDNMHNEVGFGYRMLRVLDRYNISFEHIPSGIDTMSLVISDSKLKEHLEQVLREIQRDCEPQSIEVHSNMALVATVGKGMIRSLGVAARLFGALYEAGVNVRMIDQGSSEMNIIVGIENDDLNTAVKAIYRAFA
ncbi:MAG: aspartate kinase, partial [Eubacteriales bacterium]|jgi:aspartate kinase|nr:aspartate kinase [Eubacteriales bacterium]